MSPIYIVVASFLILMAAFPLRNWLEIRRVRKIDAEWSRWLSEKPSREEYCLETNQNINEIKCNFCGSLRHPPRLEAQIEYKPKFGFVSNKFQINSYFKTFICSGCNTQLYRERYEK